MLPERNPINEHPFEYFKNPKRPYAEMAQEEEGYLKTLGLCVESNIDEVRRVAITMRAQMREKGLNVESVNALRWALKRSDDCQDDRDFMSFLLGNSLFESYGSLSIE